MPQLVPVTLDSVPFAVSSVSPQGLGTLFNRVDGVAINEKTVTLSGRAVAGASSHKAMARVKIPVIRTINGVATSVGLLEYFIECKLSDHSTEAERLDGLQTVQGLLAAPEYLTVFRDAAAVY